MQFTMPYGQGSVSATIESFDVLGAIDIGPAPALADPAEAARQAMAAPVGLPGHCLDDFAPGETVAIIVSDSFRKTGMEHILPTLVDGLLERGIAEEDLFFVYATGTHRGPTPEEEAQILGPELYARFADQTFSHDPFTESELVFRGVTSRGTRVWFNRLVMDADKVIATGTVVLHYFGGLGGGRKSILPGVAGVETIAHNHALNLDKEEDRLNPDVRIGVLDGNPVAEDMLEGARMVDVAFIVNTVLNRDGAIAGVFAGEMDQAHRAAADFARRIYCVPIQEQADLVIASAGGAKNYLQSHKALFNAYQAVKPDGAIIFLAEAAEGLGGNKLKDWLALGSRAAIIAELRRNAEINGQTALSTIEKSAITLFVTALEESDVQVLGGRKAASLEAAIATAFEERLVAGVTAPTAWLMPAASYTVPMMG